MLVKDIIKLACVFTENEDLAGKIEEDAVLSEEEELIAQSLLNCFNLINNEIATEYLPYIKTQTMQTNNFKIYFSYFKSCFAIVYWICDSLVI